jgi:putative DNA primase/helicase
MTEKAEDINDFSCKHGPDATRVRFDHGTSSAGSQNGAATANGKAGAEWREPKPLPSGLKPVDAFAFDFVPKSLAPWIADISERLQCPPDYVAVAAMVALGCVIGRRVGIRPQLRTDWTEFPNLWGGFVGRPGMLKSPAMMAALKHLHRLEAQAAAENKIAMEAYAAGLDHHKLQKQVAAALMKKTMHEKMKKGEQKGEGADKDEQQIDFGIGEEPQKPLPIRFRTNDTSYEKLGELLIANPSGILIERDELVSLLIHLDREEQSVARGFYLSGWSGNQPYTFDRIARGHLHVDAICIGLLGNTQPARIGDYVRRANFGGAGGDGLIQRFGLFVWPDALPDWRDVDKYPDRQASEAAWKVFERASKMEPLKLGALMDGTPYWRLDEAALDDFRGWRSGLEMQLRSGSMSPALEGHLAKYRKLIPALALINHVADVEDGGFVGQYSLLRALAFGKYLESHARRLYSSTSEGERAAAAAILAHVKAGHLVDGFTARDVHQRDWGHLTVREDVQAGLEMLVDHLFIAAMPARSGPAGGRPTVTYAINPRLKP